jgi:hypothetical protein
VTHQNADGKVWAERLRVSENYFKENSLDWAFLYELYCDIDAQRKRWRTNVSLGWAIVNNLIADEGLNDPEYWLTSLRTDADPDMEAKLRSLSRTLHRVNGTKDCMDDGRVLCAIYGHAVHWSDFKQVSEPAYTGEFDEVTGKPMVSVDDDGNELSRAVEQEVIGELVSPYDMRYDPDGRRWDLKDMKWIARCYSRSLQDFEEDPAIDDEALKVLRQWDAQKMQDRRTSKRNEYGGQNFDEKDAGFRMIDVWEIHSRVDKKIYHVPVGFEYCVLTTPFSRWAMKTGLYPATIIAYNKNPDDPQKKKGFYGIPDLRLIRSPLENLNKLERLYVDYATTIVQKYFVPDGIFDKKALAKIQSLVTRELIEVDLGTLFKKLGISGTAGELQHFDIRKLIMRMSQEDREDGLKLLEGMSHELDVIYQTIGQGPSERGGISAADSATESINIRQMLEKRINKRFNRSLDIIDTISEKQLLIVKHMSTLPIRYDLAMDNGEEVWSKFAAEQIEDIDFMFRARSNASRPLTKTEYQNQLKEAMSLVLPMLQGNVTRELRFMIRSYMGTFDIPGIKEMFKDETPELAKQALMLIDHIRQTGDMSPAVGSKVIEMLASLANALLSPADIEEVARDSASEKPAETAQQQSGSPVAARSTGQNAFADAAGLAAAGQLGGLQNG